MRNGLTEADVQAALGDLDGATALPPATVAALRLADRLTEPADLARSPFYEYAFTLVP